MRQSEEYWGRYCCSKAKSEVFILRLTFKCLYWSLLYGTTPGPDRSRCLYSRSELVRVLQTDSSDHMTAQLSPLDRSWKKNNTAALSNVPSYHHRTHAGFLQAGWVALNMQLGDGVGNESAAGCYYWATNSCHCVATRKPRSVDLDVFLSLTGLLSG